MSIWNDEPINGEQRCDVCGKIVVDGPLDSDKCQECKERDKQSDLDESDR